MNKVSMSLLCAAAFILTGPGFAQTPPPAEHAAVAPSAARPMHHERHPEIRKAMRKLRAAKADLEKATRDYAGHRVKAIEAINEALAQLREALQSDKQ